MRDTRYEIGSALILTVVLTSLLAIIGVMFVMVARVDRVATSAISENRELNFAVETVVAKISQELALDVPGMPKGGEYYDYPDEKNEWLASLEPYDSGGYKWRQISNVYEKPGLDPELPAGIIPDYQKPSDVGDSNSVTDYPADADGDGVADSKWIELEGINSNKGKPIYAAIRVIDNGGMLNVNTAYKFDPNEINSERIDGSSQMQINLAALSQRGDNGSLDNAADDLQDERCGSEPNDLSMYEENVVWQYHPPAKDTEYTPFDISDELKLRNRYILNYNLMVSRIEKFWEKAYDWGLKMPRNERDHSISNPNHWFWKTNNSSWDVNEYDYRHIGTIYNMDRIIDPDGDKKVNINRDNIGLIYGALRKVFSAEPNFVGDVNEVAAQIAVNLKDFRDNDSNVTVYPNPDDGKTYYGFERPCIYISELAHRFFSPGPRETVHRSYAIELYKPYSGDDPNGWRLVVGGTSITIDNWTGGKQFYVIRDQNSNAPLDVNSGATVQDATFAFTVNTEIRLERPLPGGGYITADWYEVDPCIPAPWLLEDNVPHSVQRDIQPHKCIRRLWATVARNDIDELGTGNSYVDSDLNVIQAHPANKDFTNIGEIGMLFRKGAYYRDSANRNKRIGYGINKTEGDVRLNLADLNYQRLFKYLTVWPPSVYVSDPNETRIKGRININTAPWYVLAQLPWVTDPTLAPGDPDRYKLAQAIAEYRDDPLVEGFRSIGELMNVTGMDYYAADPAPSGFPDLTPNDNVGDDFEERDVIFARISNLVTVRSDVFTAYILVRIGTDGPQKRVIAILDRSDVYSPTDKVKIVAVHPVPDPR